MFADQCVSVSDLRKNISHYVKEVKQWPKIIFANNRPIAVLTSIDSYALEVNPTFSFDFDPPLDPKDVLSHFGRD